MRCTSRAKKKRSMSDCIAMVAWWKRQSGSKVLECGLLGIGNQCLWKVESSQGYGASESHMYKVAALRLFHPTVSSDLFGPGFNYYDTVSWREGMKGRGKDRGPSNGVYFGLSGSVSLNISSLSPTLTR